MLRGAVFGIAFAALLAAPSCLLAAAAESTLNRPPISAPTVVISSTSLPVVRSQTEVVEDFVAGLIPGLMTNYHRVEGVSFIAVRDDHIVVREDFGLPDSNKPFDAGTQNDLFAALAAMQQIEQAKMLATEAVDSGVTLEQALTHQSAGDPKILIDAVSRVSRQSFGPYLTQRIFTPLKMTQSLLDDSGLKTSVADMGQLTVALLNGGAAGGGRVLQPATVELMERTHVVTHPALPGMTYGFAEMRRNGWRALAHDGQAPGVQTRLVLVPEARFGYFVMVKGAANAAFWRTLDNAFFDHVFATHREADYGLHGTAAPSVDAAKAVAGFYGPAEDYPSQATPLKTAWTRLSVEARDDGALVLSGVENAVLSPREGGYWSAGDDKLNAVYRNGMLMLSSGNYEALAPWLRWDFYLMAALAAAFLAMGAFTFEHRGRRTGTYAPSNLVLAGGMSAAAFGLVSLLMWLLPAV